MRPDDTDPRHKTEASNALRRLLIYLPVFAVVPVALIVAVAMGRVPGDGAMPLLIFAFAWMAVVKLAFGSWVQTGKPGPVLRTPAPVRDWRRGDHGRALFGQGRVSDIVGVALLAGAILLGWLAPHLAPADVFIAVALLAVVIVFAGRVIGARHRRSGPDAPGSHGDT